MSEALANDAATETALQSEGSLGLRGLTSSFMRSAEEETTETEEVEEVETEEEEAPDEEIASEEEAEEVETEEAPESDLTSIVENLSEEEKSDG